MMSGTDAYQAFLATKTPTVPSTGLAHVPELGHHLFPHQRHAVDFALRVGRTGLFLDTGLGKSLCELEFAQVAAKATNDHALILAPLAVAAQIVRDGTKWGYDARQVRRMEDVRPGISVCNYDRLDGLDAGAFGAVVLDESSVLKNFTGKTTRKLIDAFADTRFKLAATATPAPNDHMELGQHSEFLGVMPSNEMLMRWFISDQKQMGRYRLKGHAVESFWDWMASWCCMASNPSDLGFDGSAWELPPMEVIRHRVEGAGDTRKMPGELFATPVDATTMFSVKRDTVEARAAAVASLIGDSDEPWLIWCDTNFEGESLVRAVAGARDVRGSHSEEKKEATLGDFVAGRLKRLVTKPSIAGQGLNFQHCWNVVFVGRSFSYEAWYQAVRRCWRFGQTHRVQLHLIVAEGEEQIGRVIARKEGSHLAMKEAMARAQRRRLSQSAELKRPYLPNHMMELRPWIRSIA